MTSRGVPNHNSRAKYIETSPEVMALRKACDEGKVIGEAAAAAKLNYATAYALVKRFKLTLILQRGGGKKAAKPIRGAMPDPEDLVAHYAGMKKQLRW